MSDLTKIDLDDPLFRVVLNENQISIKSGPLNDPKRFHATLAEVLTPCAVIPLEYFKMVHFHNLILRTPLTHSKDPRVQLLVEKFAWPDDKRPKYIDTRRASSIKYMFEERKADIESTCLESARYSDWMESSMIRTLDPLFDPI